MSGLNNYIIKTIKKQVDGTITSANTEALEKILNSDFMPHLTKNEVEKEIFLHIHNHRNVFKETVNKLIHYMVFDYNISEDNSLNINEFTKKEYESIFAARNLTKELNVNNTTKKSLKV